MARIRTIKPEFPQSESMGRVSRDARLCFVNLFTIVDDAGRTRGSSRLLASLLYPYDEDAGSLMEGWLDELERETCIARYEAEGNCYLQISNWLKHQKIDKPSLSRLPPFVEASRILANVSEDSGTYLVPVPSTKYLGTVPKSEDTPPSSHEQRKEKKTPNVTPITPSMVAQGVLTECCLASDEVLGVITDVVKAESKLPGYDPTTLRDKMIAAWREFEAASPKLTQFAPGAAKFFGEARWRNKSKWGWKEGMEPPAARRYINTDSPSLLDKVRAQLGPEALAERDARIVENKLKAIPTTF
jgi:hypothetical protein